MPSGLSLRGSLKRLSFGERLSGSNHDADLEARRGQPMSLSQRLMFVRAPAEFSFSRWLGGGLRAGLPTHCRGVRQSTARPLYRLSEGAAWVWIEHQI